MKKSKFTEEQIAFALHQAATGAPVEEVCRKLGISQATLYAWKKKYGGMGVSELRRPAALEQPGRQVWVCNTSSRTSEADVQPPACAGHAARAANEHFPFPWIARPDPQTTAC